MRRFMIVLAVATTLAAGAVGRAAAPIPVSCVASAPSKLSCENSFTLSSTTSVTLRLLPDVGYTGSLQARIVLGTNTLATAAAYYAAGQVAPITTTGPETIVALPAGTYKLIVESAKPVSVCTSKDGMCVTPTTPRPAPHVNLTAAGGYSAEVTETV